MFEKGIVDPTKVNHLSDCCTTDTDKIQITCLQVSLGESSSRPVLTWM
jgi:hypothetical protein